MLYITQETETVIETKNWLFNRRNINRIAYEYDTELIRFEPDIQHATYKDKFNRLLFVDGKNYTYKPTNERKEKTEC